MGVAVGVGVGALVLGLATLGFLLRRRRAAKKKAADPSASHPDGGANLEEGGGEPRRQQRQLDISSAAPITVAAAGGSEAGGPPPSVQQNSAPSPPSPPPYANGGGHLPGAPPLPANQQHAAVAADTNVGKDSEPVRLSFAASTADAVQKPSSEGEANPPCDGDGSGGAGGGGDGVQAGESGSSRSAAAEQVSTATGSTANVSTEERTAELAGADFGGLSAEDGGYDAPAAAVDAAATPAAAAAPASGRRRTSSGVGYGQAALAAAEELAHSCQIPGVSEAATMVSILIRLVTDSRDCTTRGSAGLKRCRSIVMMLERAATVLGKVSDTANLVRNASTVHAIKNQEAVRHDCGESVGLS